MQQPPGRAEQDETGDGAAPPEAARWSGAVRVLARLAPLVGLALFSVAIVALHRTLSGAGYREFLAGLAGIAPARLALAGALTAAAYSLLTRYDALALRHLGLKLPWGTTLLGAFVGYAFANTVGFGPVSGGSVRYRFYAAEGLSALDVARVAVFCSATLWFGFCVMAGTTFMLVPLSLPAGMHVPLAATRTFGTVLLAAALAYLLLVLSRRDISIRGLSLRTPAPAIALAQLLVACADWAVAATAMWVLLPAPARASWPYVLAVFLLAQVAGIASQVPGGLGVFEGIVVVLLAPLAPAAALLGALAAFRVVYYVLPLVAATLLLGGNEIVQRRGAFRAVARSLSPWVPRIAPPVLAAMTMLAGVVLLFSGAMPASHARLARLADVVTLPVVELSHVLASLVGASLLLLARPLQRRLDAAWSLSCALLATGIGASLLRGLDWEAAALLAVLLLALVPCRHDFYRKAPLFSERLTPAWISTFGLVIACTVFLGLFAHSHVAWRGELWRQFELAGDAPRFLRATAGAACLLLLAAGTALLRRPERPLSQEPPTDEEIARVRGIVAASSASSASLALLRDKSLLFSDSGRGFVMYGAEGRSRVSMGSPIGPPEERAELAWRFREACDREGAWCVFYEVPASDLPLYVDLGLSLVALGERARVPLGAFTLEGADREGLRAVVRPREREGSVFEVVPREDVHALIPELRGISDEWLAGRHAREQGFSLGFFDERYVSELPCAIVRKEGRIVAFAAVWSSGDGSELSADLVRHRADAPPGTLELLLSGLMLWGRERGIAWFDLGLVPPSRPQDRALVPPVSRLDARVPCDGETADDAEALRRCKERFRPEWTPVYVASPGGLALPAVFANVAALVARGPKVVVSR